ncbi:MAG: hypothetical protein EB075_13350, partial [Bacteroidetes bacterium]|nr:hypothetical protein [Bacteroidota bacterium]
AQNAQNAQNAPELEVDLTLHTPELKRKLIDGYFRGGVLPVPYALFDVDTNDDASPFSYELLFKLMQLSIGMAFKEEYVPSRADTLKFMSAITVHGTHEMRVDVQYRLMASTIVRYMIAKSRTMAMFFDPPAEKSDEKSNSEELTNVMELSNWWTSKYAIPHLTLRLLEFIRVDPSVLNRFHLISRLQNVYAVLEKIPHQVDFKTVEEIVLTQKKRFVWGEICPASGQVVPSAFINQRDRDNYGLPISCVYCTCHPDTIDYITETGCHTTIPNPLGGQSYHNDGTPSLRVETCIKVHEHPPLYLIPVDDDALDAMHALHTVCSKCKVIYPVMDVRRLKDLANLQPRCVGCRKGRGSVPNPVTYTKECVDCQSVYSFAFDVTPSELIPHADNSNHNQSQSQSTGFRCATCYNAQLPKSKAADQTNTRKIPLTCTTTPLTLAQYIDRSEKLRAFVASSFGVEIAMLDELVKYYLETKKKKLYMHDSF